MRKFIVQARTKTTIIIAAIGIGVALTGIALADAAGIEIGERSFDAAMAAKHGDEAARANPRTGDERVIDAVKASAGSSQDAKDILLTGETKTERGKSEVAEAQARVDAAAKGHEPSEGSAHSGGSFGNSHEPTHTEGGRKEVIG